VAEIERSVQEVAALKTRQEMIDAFRVGLRHRAEGALVPIKKGKQRREMLFHPAPSAAVGATVL
jgi:hypothetical protein